jgi:hypothetical protein
MKDLHGWFNPRAAQSVGIIARTTRKSFAAQSIPLHCNSFLRVSRFFLRTAHAAVAK